MKNKLLVIATIVSLVLSTIALTASVRVIFPKEDNQVIIIEEGDTINQINQTIINQTTYYILVQLEIGTLMIKDKKTYRPVYNYVIGRDSMNTTKYDNCVSAAIYNVTIEVHFPYENETYRGYTVEIYGGPARLYEYWLWDVTDIQGEYMDAMAYGWLREDA